MFYNGCTELHEENVNWEDFKSAFRGRFREIHSTYIILRNCKPLVKEETNVRKGLQTDVDG